MNYLIRRQSERYKIIVFIFILLTTDIISIMTLSKVNIFSIGKESYESIQTLSKLWLILSALPLFSPIRYLILSKILSQELKSNNNKYII